jgi:hypothetical protein
VRELRFRAWHEKLGRMFDDVCVDSNGTELLDDTGKAWWIGHEHIMQFTGLKDKNGREIYQFDLWKLGDEIYLIVWKEGDWQTGWKKLAGDNYTDIGKDNAKSGLIIGNLLENPELFNVPSEKGE